MVVGTNNRRLAAIFVADVADYSRMMGMDENKTHQIMMTQRNAVIDLEIAAYAGKIVHTAGDGVLAEFPSVIAAVDCAVAMQNKLSAKEFEIADGMPLRWRIGVNYGDVIVEREDIYGDCVNIAARLESLAEPGGICISEKVFREVNAKVGATFESIGAQRLKNIVEPITVYRSSFELGKIHPSKADSHRSHPDPLVGRPSLAILPFNNLTPESANQYLVEGLTEELIIDLSMSPEFFVIDRRSSFIFADKNMDLREVAQRLGVQYLVVGTLQQSEASFRVSAELIDALSGIQIWAGRYDRENALLLEVRDEIARSIAAALMTTVGPIAKAELSRQATKPPQDFTVYDRYLKARDCFHRSILPPWKTGREWSQRAKQEFARAIAMSDPPYWPAVAGLAWQHAIDFDWDYSDDLEKSGNMAFELASQAVKNAPELHLGHWVMGWAHLMVEQDYERAEYHYNLARALNVGDSRLVAEMAQLYIYTARYERAIMNLNQAIRLSPYHEQWYDEFLAWAHEENGEPERAIEILSRLSELEGIWSHCILARSYLQMGRKKKAREQLRIIDDLSKEQSGRPFTLRAWEKRLRQKEPYRDEARFKRVVDLTADVIALAAHRS